MDEQEFDGPVDCARQGPRRSGIPFGAHEDLGELNASGLRDVVLLSLVMPEEMIHRTAAGTVKCMYCQAEWIGTTDQHDDPACIMWVLQYDAKPDWLKTDE